MTTYDPVATHAAKAKEHKRNQERNRKQNEKYYYVIE